MTAISPREPFTQQTIEDRLRGELLFKALSRGVANGARSDALPAGVPQHIAHELDERLLRAGAPYPTVPKAMSRDGGVACRGCLVRTALAATSSYVPRIKKRHTDIAEIAHIAGDQDKIMDDCGGGDQPVDVAARP